MENDNIITLLPESGSEITSSRTPNRWQSVEMSSINGYVKNFVTSNGSAEGKTDKFRTLISGVPSPWARVMLTRKAVSQNSADLGNTVLDECYKLLKSEWRGLMAAYVLRPDRFEFSEPIKLTGRNTCDNDGHFNVRYLYGKMLFEEAPLWTYKNDGVDQDSNPPCIQILYYKKSNSSGEVDRVPVAATSPYTILFTALNYNLLSAKNINEIPWIDGDGKFIDPTKLNEGITGEELQRLHAFVNNVRLKIKASDDTPTPEDFYQNWIIQGCGCEKNKHYNIDVKDVETNIGAWSSELQRWENELDDKLKGMGVKVNDNVPLFNVKPQGPLALLMNYEKEYYIQGGNCYFELNAENASNDSVHKISSSDIFIKSDYIAAWCNTGNPDKDYSNSAAYYLRTTDNQFYLPFPFTPQVFVALSNSIDTIMQGGGSNMNGNASTSNISVVATSQDGKRVDITLYAKINGNNISICKKTYDMEIIPESAGKVMVWPDFASVKWNKYLFYNEFPSNVIGIRMIPHFENIEPVENDTPLEKTELITYPVGKVPISSHKYEIIETNKPLKYVTIQINKGGEDIEVGTLWVKQVEGDNHKGVMKKLNVSTSEPVSVGIDFGSTNTCAYYADKTVPKPIPFTNRRLPIVGFENPKKALAEKDELLFVSNESTLFRNGQVKSWLHTHHPQYTNTPDNASFKEIEGGVPVNESNIIVQSLDENTIQTNAGKLYYNMKWVSDTEAGNRKQAFLTTLWYQICADLFDNGRDGEIKVPKTLFWSYPSSMNKGDKRNFQRLYTSLTYPFTTREDKPVCKELTEAEAACAYAFLSTTDAGIGNQGNRQGLSIAPKKELFLGVDIGGSTSDILLVNNDGVNNALIAQSSVRMAGGFFFPAINSSEKFRKSLHRFHEAKVVNLKVLNIADIISPSPDIYKRAPYYLNNVFDQINSKQDFNKFYSYMNREVPDIFALPAYITGVLTYYTGMLVRNVVNRRGLDEVRKIKMRYFGKGGRLFEWLLDIYDTDAKQYYHQCFASGFGDSSVGFSIENTNESQSENKSEVAIGLVSSTSGLLDADSYGRNADTVYDIVGEKGFSMSEGKEVSDLDVIPDEMFDGGIHLALPEKFENFNNFIDIFSGFLKDSGGILKDSTLALKQGVSKIDIRAFIQNDPEYIKCREKYDPEDNDRPIYRMPLFIAEALSYLHYVLLPTVSSQID